MRERPGAGCCLNSFMCREETGSDQQGALGLWDLILGMNRGRGPLVCQWACHHLSVILSPGLGLRLRLFLCVSVQLCVCPYQGRTGQICVLYPSNSSLHLPQAHASVSAACCLPSSSLANLTGLSCSFASSGAASRRSGLACSGRSVRRSQRG